MDDHGIQLPISLDPLPDESLPGFLLRLSCRLELPVDRIATLTGLVPPGKSGARLPAALLATLSAPAAQSFADTTRLTSYEVAQLCLSSLEGRYPLSPGATKNAAAFTPSRSDRWLFVPSTRYCPSCLAGDGSPVQQAFGGAWRKVWHLPVVFACPQHQRLLEDRCPECEQLVHGARPGAHSGLLPAMRARPLHPAQCRTTRDPGLGRTPPTCCGARLDAASGHRLADPRLITLQRKILNLLTPNGPSHTHTAGQPAPAVRYFADLRVLSLLICSTWPALRHLSPSENTAAAVDRHTEWQQKRIADLLDGSPTARARSPLDLPASDAAAGAGLLGIADSILTSDSPDVIRDQIRPLLPTSTRQTRRTFWGGWVTRYAPSCSSGLQAAYEPLLRRFTKTGGRPQARRAAVTLPRRWGPEHIPAFLPEDWYTRHFTPLDDVNPMFVRRTAVLRLVQMVAGGSLGEAAGFLRIADTSTTWLGKGRIYSGAGHVHSTARNQTDPLAFDAALRALASELDAPTTPLIDYQKRRRALQAWSINEETWTELVSRLPPIPGPQKPELGDRKRQIASIYVWTRITKGEHHFAPRPIEAAQPPDIQEAWSLRRNTIWHLMQSSRPRPHYTGLKAELDPLAAQLARMIDTGQYTGTGVNQLDQVSPS
ncbi:MULTISPECIES: TniQ family protein [Streptomyces]|uniref:TniQ family protein n=1 Tax=Streptomyces TaxID=1883 RepID=UPI00067C74E9|nr:MULTISPECIES: TniQ family protein [Streptomyces]KOT58362.1 hypothetical protein ADK43_18575 [Streptomyces rimosus subsp. rimosus]